MLKSSYKEIIVIFSVMMLLLSSCTRDDAASSSVYEPVAASAKESPSFINWQEKDSRSLDKIHTTTKYITKDIGGEIGLAVNASDTPFGDVVYGVSAKQPYSIYKIDSANVSTPEKVGELAFMPAAIATHPVTGLVYYTGRRAMGGYYPIGVWNPQKNINYVLPMGSKYFATYKMAFGPDGTLYAVAGEKNTKMLFTINTVSGEWQLFQEFGDIIGGTGDMSFSPTGQLYNLDKQLNLLSRIDLGTRNIHSVGSPGKDNMEGLAFTNEGELMASRFDESSGDIFLMNKENADMDHLGSSGIGWLPDLAPITLPEEATVSMHITVLPGAMSESGKVSLSIDDAVLGGAVDVTFGPHGTTFDPPALLNITATNLDLTGVNPDSIQLYYDNTETGEWEVMETEDIIVLPDMGYIRVLNGKLPHFSRYALSKD